MAKKELLEFERLFGKYLIYYREGKIERDTKDFGISNGNIGNTGHPAG
jgi:hypothetical protein